jgi:hypothetical protein
MSRNKDSMNFIMRVFVLAFAVVVLSAGASSAYADAIVNYQISGPGPKGSFTASFTLPQNPTPSGGNQLGFDFANLPVDVNGTWENLTVYFYNGLIGEGVGGSNSFSLFALGQQLYSWSASASTPTMDLGTFYALGAGAGGGGGLYTVTVTDPPGAVPEPASVTLLGMGLLILCGVRLRRRSA